MVYCVVVTSYIVSDFPMYNFCVRLNCVIFLTRCKLDRNTPMCCGEGGMDSVSW